MEPTFEEWDPSMPGAGAQRVIAISQLYFRIMNYAAETILVADSLALVFGSRGATVPDLVNFLGLHEKRIKVGIESIPANMRCVLTDLPSHVRADITGEQETDKSKEGPHYFLNYKGILITAYAHVTRMLLAASATILPQQLEQVQKAMAQLRGSGSGKEPTAEPALEINVSPALQRSEATEGIFCRSCNTYFTLSDFNKTLTRCPTCSNDVLKSSLDVIADQYRDYLQTGGSLVSVLRQGREALKLLRQFATPSSPAEAGEAPARAAPTTRPAKRPHPAQSPHASALSKDPFLVQQGMVFLYFYSTKFAHIGETNRPVIDVDDILTEREYERRLEGKSLIADAFRAVHRNPSALHCKLVSQDAVEQRKLAENAQKMEKRKQLPPWLLHTTTWSSLQTVPDASSRIANEEPPSLAVGSELQNMSSTPAVHKGDGKVERRPQNRKGIEVSAATARFVAEDFLQNEFEEVLLPAHKKMKIKLDP